jgi:uncharacterized protein (DUF924 family)
MTSASAAAEIVSFWREAGYERWFEADEAFDRTIRERFLAIHEAAARGECDSFEESPEGVLALAILFDQFPRNMFRGGAHAFATDPLARGVARRSIDRGFDRAIDETMRIFLYMPFMHSEALADQDLGVRLFEALGDPEQLKYARHHREIIARFGRFPHRNRALGRETTAEEQAFLDGGGFKG